KRNQQLAQPPGQHQAQRSSDDCQKQTFSEQLLDQPKSLCAETEAHGNFPLPRRCSRKQETGDVRARDQQYQSDSTHEHKQRLRKLPSKLVQAFVPRYELKRRTILLSLLRFDHPIDVLSENSFELGASLLLANAG